MRLWLSLALVAALFASGCTYPSPPDASPQTLAAVAYSDPGQTRLTLITVVNNRTGSGGHSALMVDGSERLLFDPAGSFQNERTPEKGDVLYGMTPAMFAAYKAAHARNSHHVVLQEIDVTPAQADAAAQLVKNRGHVSGGACARSTSALLTQVPGFQSIERTMWPVNLQEQFAQLPGVRTEYYYENDAGEILSGPEELAF